MCSRWQDQLAAVERSLAADPNGPWVWLWEMRIKIYRYLLSRYPAGSAIDPHDLVFINRVAEAEGLTNPPPETSVAHKAAPDPTWAVPPKPRAAVRKQLRNIADCNADRRADYEQQRGLEIWQGLVTRDDFDRLAKFILKREVDENTFELLTPSEITAMIADELNYETE